MTTHHRLSPVKPAAALTLLAAPLLVLGALLSKMDTMERYYTQLGIAGTVALLGVVASIGSLMNRNWARWLLIVLYGLAAVFWIYAAITSALSPSPGAFGISDVALQALIGIVCASFAVALFFYCQAGTSVAKAECQDDA